MMIKRQLRNVFGFARSAINDLTSTDLSIKHDPLLRRNAPNVTEECRLVP